VVELGGRREAAGLEEFEAPRANGFRPMKSISLWINFLADGLIRLCCWLLVVIGIAMSIVIFLQVIFRFVIYVPFPWSEEMARYLMIWMGMLGSVVAMRKGRHIGVTVMIDRLSPKTRVPLLLSIRVVMMGFLFVIAKEGFSLAVFNAPQRSPAMEIPMLYPYLAIPVGAVLMMIEILADILRSLFPTEAEGKGTISSQLL